MIMTNNNNQLKQNSNILLSKRDLFLKWSLGTTFHGYPKIFQYKNNKCIQLLWTIAFMACFVLTAWLVAQAIIDFFSFDSVSKIEIITERPSVFPTVTLCQHTPFSSKYAENLLHNISLNSYNIIMPDDIDSLDKIKNITELAKMYVSRDGEFYVVERKRMGLNWSKVISQCYFNGRKCNLSRDFNLYFSFVNGNCFQFNANLSRLRTVELEGESYGLSLILGPLSDENHLYPATMSNNGIKVFVHNQSFSSLSSQEHVYVETGKEISISVRLDIN